MRNPTLLCFAAASLALPGAACGLFGDDPPRDRDAPGADGDAADGDTATGPGAGVLSGSWPQASIGRPGGVRPAELALGWRVDEGAVPGTGTGWGAVACPARCGGTCGIGFELAEDRMIEDLLVAVGDDQVFLAVQEGADAQHLEDPRGARSRLLRVGASEGLVGREELTPDLKDAAARVGLAVDGDVAFLARDILHIDHPDGAVLLAVGHLFVAPSNGGNGWEVRDVALGLDALTGRVRFALHLPAEVFTITRPGTPTYQAFAARLLSDGRLVVLRDGFVEETGRLFIGSVPRDGEVVAMAPLALEEEGFGFSVSHLEVDPRDRLYTVGQELVRYPLCAPEDLPRPRTRLRVFAPPVGLDARLLHDEGGLARSFEAVSALTVAPAPGGHVRAIVSGRDWNDPSCSDGLLHFMKSKDTFSADEDDLSACPSRFEAACTSGGDCPCAGCQGLQQLCPGSIFGPPPPSLVYVATFATEPDAVEAFAPVEARGFAVLADGPIVTDGGDRALVAGSALSLLDLSGGAKDPVIWQLPGWNTRSGLTETTPPPLFGSWYTPIFSADGSRFAAGLMASDTVGRVLDTGSIQRTLTQRGGIVTGLSSSGPVARAVGRERVAVSTLAALGESDRLFPLAGGDMLQVFSWRGPAPVVEDTPGHDRRIELRRLVPEDPPSYFQDKDLYPVAGDPIPEIELCTGPTREERDACAFPLPARVLESDVSVDAAGQPKEPREVDCLERGSDGKLIEGCDVDELRERWEDGQAETLARPSTGMIIVRCESPTARREPLEEKAVRLIVGCTAFKERFLPSAPSALLSLEHRPHVDVGCDAALGPGPFRAVFARVPFEVVVSDESGRPIGEAEVGGVVVLTIVRSGGSGATPGAKATYEIVSGAGTLNGGGTEVTVNAGEPVDLEASAEGVIVVRVTLYDADGNVIGTQEIAIAVEGGSGCTGNDDGTVMKPCHARLPYRVPQAPGAFEARTSPAEAGVGVLLHDRSLRVSEIDADEGGQALPLAIARTYRSAHPEDEGGLAGGWHFALDVRLAPVTPADAAGQVDPTWLLDEDLGAERFYDVAIADADGRIDTWRHPGTSEVVDFGAGPAWHVWDAATGRAVRKSFRARVTTYRAPVDSFAILRSYTLLLDEGQPAFEVHPYWHEDRGFRPNERRFYELSEPSGLRRIFDCKGRLVLMIDPQLREIELVYEGEAHPLTRTRRLSAVIDSAGRRWEIDWKTIGDHPRIAKITDPFERTIEYVYTLFGDDIVRLAQVTYRADDADPALAVTKITRYRYDGDGRLVAILREHEGREIPWLAIEWDGERVAREVRGELPGGEVWTFDNREGGVVVTDGRGTERTYALGAVPDGPWIIVRESHARKIADETALTSRREVDAVATTAWTHFDSGLPKSVTTPLGRVIAYEYTPRGLPKKQTETGADGLTRTASWQWDNANATSPPGFECQVLTSETSVTGAKTFHAFPPFDPAAPGRACQDVEVSLPDGVRIDGQAAIRRIELEYVTGGPHRGAIAKRTVLEDGQPQLTTTLTYPAATTAEASYADKAPEDFIGLPVTIVEEVPRPSQCSADTLTRAQTALVRDARGNVARRSMLRRGVPHVVATTWDAADRAVVTIEDPDALAHETRTRYDHEDRVVEERKVIRDEDPLGLAAEPEPERELVRRIYYDPAGNRVADGLTGAGAHAVELYRWDDAGGLLAELRPGTGSDDTAIAAVLAELEAGKSASDVIGEHDPRNSGRDNYTSAAPDGSPVTPALDPRWVARHTRLDAEGLAARVETTGGYGGEVGCIGCDGMYTRIETSYRDLEGRLRVFDPGRTDRGDGATRVMTVHRYDGLGRMIATELTDPEGCDGPATVVRRETLSDLTADDHPRMVEIHGDSGHGDFCDNDALLAKVDMSWTDTGLLREKKRQRFALLSALAAPGGALTTRYAWDHAERIATLETSGDDAGIGRRDATRYALADAVCWIGSGPADAIDYDLERKLGTDELGLAASETELHHGEAGTVAIARTFEHDALGRMLRAKDGLGTMRRELAWDSLGNVRAEHDVRGAVNESRYDGLGQLVATAVLTAVETRTTRLTRQAGVVVGEESDAHTNGTRLVLGERRWRYDAFGRAAVTFPRGEAFPAEAVVTAFGDADQPIVQRTASGIVLRHELDAFGNVARADASFPAVMPAGWDVPAGRTLSRTTAKSFRFDALGRITEGATFAGDARLTHFTRDWDSLSGLLRELQDLDAASSVTQHTDTFARYDDRGRALRVESDRGRIYDGAIEYRYDHLDRMIEAKAATDEIGEPGLWEFAHPERISWSWAGDLLATRTVVVGSSFDPALASTWTTTYDYDELGQRHRVQHARPPASGGTFYEHRRWYRKGDVAAEKAVMFVDGEEQGDLGPAFAALALNGVSHLMQAPPESLFAVPADFETWDDNPWDSCYEVRDRDQEGRVERSVTHRYAPYAGALSVSGRWSLYEGGRLANESTMVFDPDKEKAIEVKHAAFTWSADGAHITRAAHQLARKVAVPFARPAIGDGTLAGMPAERSDRLGFEYGGESQAVHDGCDLGSGSTCVTPARHRFVYDPWGQLEYVAADEPDACRMPGPGADDVFPVADGLRVVHDALGRRVLEKWQLPTGCTGPSSLPAERDRSFVHHGDTLVEERILQSEAEGGDGVLRRVPGPEGVAWLAVRFGGAHRGHFIVFDDADGGIAGLYDVAAGVLVQAASPLPWFRPHQMLALDPSLGIGFRMVTAGGVEQQPFAKLSFVPGSGFALDLHGNPLADRWYATRQASEGFFESVVQKILLALDAVSIATSWIPIVGDIIGFVADLGHLAWDLVQEGPSWGLAGRALMAVGIAAVGLAANLGGPPAWGAKTALRAARVGARAAKTISAASRVARTADRLDDVADAYRATYLLRPGVRIVGQRLDDAEKLRIATIVERKAGVKVYFNHPAIDAHYAAQLDRHGNPSPWLGAFHMDGNPALGPAFADAFIGIRVATREITGHELLHLVHAHFLRRTAYQTLRSSNQREAVAEFAQIALAAEHHGQTGRHLFEPDFVNLITSQLRGRRSQLSGAEYRQVIEDSFSVIERARPFFSEAFQGARLRP